MPAPLAEGVVAPTPNVVPTCIVPVVLKLVPLNVSALPVANALVLDAYTTPPDVNEDRFVPPFATGSVPVTPVVKGKPVALVRVTLVGVPNIGVTRVGVVDNTTLPVPVLVVTPVPPLATGKVPETALAG